MTHSTSSSTQQLSCFGSNKSGFGHLKNVATPDLQEIYREQSCECGYRPLVLFWQEMSHSTRSEYSHDFLMGSKSSGVGQENVSSTPSLHPKNREQSNGWG